MTPPQAPGSTSLISLQEAAERLGVHYMTAYRHVRTGRLPAHRDGVQWVVDPADLDRAVRDRAVRPGASARSPSADGLAGSASGRAEGREPGREGFRRAGRRRREDRAAMLAARMTTGDEAGVWRVVEDALSSGMDPADIYLDLLAPALRQLGDGWAAGVVTVAEEHRASAIALRLTGRLGPLFRRRGRKRGAVIVGAPAGDQHSLPGAIVADLLRGEGFEVIDLGANVPGESFAETARHTPRLIAVVIGVTAPGRDGAVRAAIRALRHGGAATSALVGGAAISGARHAADLGADAWTGRDGRTVIDAVNQAAAGRIQAAVKTRAGHSRPVR